MAVFDLSLDGVWVFKGFPEANGEQLGAYLPNFTPEGWLPAQVPGTVHTDLLANRVIPDPFKDLNEKNVQWVSDYEWWYRKEVEITQDLIERSLVELVFEGLDTFATVWVNGVKVGEANNMFTPWRFNIKGAVKAGKNLIAIRFEPVYKIAYELENKHKKKYTCLCSDNYSARPYVRKAQYSFGWDWGPTLPTYGIWRECKIIGYGKAKLRYFGALPLGVSGEKAKIKLAAVVYTSNGASLTARFVLRGFGQRIEREVSFETVAGRSMVDCIVDVSEPKLWWPRGYGEANLYDASISIFSGQELLDAAHAKVGIRSVELLQEPDEEGVSFIFKVNGVKVFCKGTNWVPADSFLPRVTAEKYNQLLSLAAKANSNMIRVWAGGVFEADVFYDLCDTLGILVWQDFMYVCAGYPEEDWFINEAKREAEEAILRLRGHPCIALWCGNNENQWLHQVLWKDRDKVDVLFGLPIYEVVLNEVCQRLDPTRPYRLSSPYGGVDYSGKHEGDRHNWEVWSHGLDYTAYLEDNGRFLSEFGWQAPPTMKLLGEYLEEKDLSPDSEAFQAHEKQTDGLKLLKGLLSVHYPVPNDMKLFVLYSQLNQGEALKTAVTHWRSRMFKTSGCLIWQLNDCWPVVSWSLIDYGLNPKPAYFFVKRAFEPIIAPLIINQGKCYAYIINETGNSLQSTLTLQIIDFEGKVRYSKQVEAVTPAYTSELKLENTLDEMPKDDRCVFVCTLKSESNIIFEDIRTVAEPRDLTLPAPSVEISSKKIQERKFVLEIQSNVYAKAIRLKLKEGTNAEFSDNFFDLIPKRLKTVTCTLEQDLSLIDFEKKLSYEAYPYGNGPVIVPEQPHTVK